MANLDDGCNAAIARYAPTFRQTAAALYGEHDWFVTKVVQFYTEHHMGLADLGKTEWEDLPQEFLDEYFADKPY